MNKIIGFDRYTIDDDGTVRKYTGKAVSICKRKNKKYHHYTLIDNHGGIREVAVKRLQYAVKKGICPLDIPSDLRFYDDGRVSNGGSANRRQKKTSVRWPNKHPVFSKGEKPMSSSLHEEFQKEGQIEYKKGRGNYVRPPSAQYNIIDFPGYEYIDGRVYSHKSKTYMNRMILTDKDGNSMKHSINKIKYCVEKGISPLLVPKNLYFTDSGILDKVNHTLKMRQDYLESKEETNAVWQISKEFIEACLNEDYGKINDIIESRKDYYVRQISKYYKGNPYVEFDEVKHEIIVGIADRRFQITNPLAYITKYIKGKYFYKRRRHVEFNDDSYGHTKMAVGEY